MPNKKLPVGSEALVQWDDKPVRVWVVKHGSDSGGCYTEVRNILGKRERFHRAWLHPVPKEVSCL